MAAIGDRRPVVTTRPEERTMKRITTIVLTMALAAPVWAKQATGAAQMPPGAAGTARQGQPAYAAPKNDAVPPADPYVDETLKTSPRHGEWVDVKTPGATPI
jgi:hypothetical protein